MPSSPKVTVVIPTRNRRQKLVRCIESVLKSDYSPVEIVVVDDASDYDVFATLRAAHHEAHVVTNKTRRLLAFCRNLGAKLSTGSLIMFLDDDNVVAPDAIRELVKCFDDSSVGVASPVIYSYEQQKKVWTSTIKKSRLPGFYILGTQKPDSVAETFSFHDAFMARRKSFFELGGFDTRNFPIHFGELDFAHRLHRAGYTSVVTPEAKVWHDVGRTHMHVDSVRSYYTLRNRILLMRRYEPKRLYIAYVLLILPSLTAYYLFHHSTAASGRRLEVALNLIRGVVQGLASPESGVPRGQVVSKSLVVHAAVDRVGPLTDFPLVSVIVPSKDSGKTISKTLQSLLNQTYPNMEIVVVDNYSRDDTLSIASRFQGVKAFTAGPERSAQVNFGVRTAKGKYIYRVDSDFVVEPTVVLEAVEVCELRGFKVVAIHNSSDPTISYWAAVRKLERDCYADDEFNIAARFFDRQVFGAAGGFDEGLIASEDYDLHNRLVAKGYKIGRVSAKEIHVGEPKHLKDVVVKHLFYGKVIIDFIAKNPRVSYRQLSPLRYSYVRHWRDFARNPKLTLGFFLYEYVRYASAVAGYLAVVS